MANETKELQNFKAETVDAVQKKITQYVSARQLVLPADYSPDNALKSAWLMLQTVVDMNKTPVLVACTRESIVNALLDMVVQGLNPLKKQGYFIAYGKQLAFQRSYFGTMAVAKAVNPRIDDIVAQVIYKDDVFKYKIVRGQKEITEHEQAFENVDDDKIKGAYCIILDVDGNVIKTEIMTFEDIKQAWKQSRAKSVDKDGNIIADTTHDKFSGEMAKRTVINRACKPIINSSSDSQLFKEIYDRTSQIETEEAVAVMIAENANKQELDLDAIENNVALPEKIVEAEVVTEPAKKIEPKKAEAKRPEPKQDAKPKPAETGEEEPGF